MPHGSVAAIVQVLRQEGLHTRKEEVDTIATEASNSSECCRCVTISTRDAKLMLDVLAVVVLCCVMQPTSPVNVDWQ